MQKFFNDFTRHFGKKWKNHVSAQNFVLISVGEDIILPNKISKAPFREGGADRCKHREAGGECVHEILDF